MGRRGANVLRLCGQRCGHGVHSYRCGDGRDVRLSPMSLAFAHQSVNFILLLRSISFLHETKTGRGSIFAQPADTCRHPKARSCKSKARLLVAPIMMPTMMRDNAREHQLTEWIGVAIALLSSCLGGTAAAITRYLAGNADPVTLAILRWGIGFLCVLPAAVLLRAKWPAWRDWPSVAGLGFCVLRRVLRALQHRAVLHDRGAGLARARHAAASRPWWSARCCGWRR